VAAKNGKSKDLMYQAYRAHKNNAKRREIDFLFEYSAWCSWWLLEDRWSKRGIGKNKLVMARKNDVGPYSIDNVFCITQSENSAEISNINKGYHTKTYHSNRKKLGISWHLEAVGKDHPKSKPVITPEGMFENASQAAERFNITRQAAAARARNKIKGWSYLE
jgi:hypothetical protein